jgi:uncharacterized protein with GYD domain
VAQRFPGAFPEGTIERSGHLPWAEETMTETNMQTFILLTRLISEEVHPSMRIEETEKRVAAKIDKYLPEVSWISNYALIGPWDYLDVFTAPDMDTAMKVSALVRHYGGAHTEMWPATQWNDFEKSLRELTEVVKQ